MSDELNPSTASPGSPPRRAVVVVGIVVVLIVALVAVLFTIDTGDGFGLVDSESVALSYLSIFLLAGGGRQARARACSTCDGSCRNRGLAGLSRMARPGLEPGTPRFSVVRPAHLNSLDLQGIP